MRYLLGASRALVSTMRPGDRMALLTFSDRVTLRVPLTTDSAAVLDALSGVAASGQTSLRDALFMALQLAPLDRTRPVILVFSDGRDTASWLGAADVLGAVQRAGVVVHAVELVDETEPDPRSATLGAGALPRQPSSAFLAELVNASGGRRWSASEPERLAGLFTEALNEMRSRYLLTYYPTNVDREGWHPVSVRLARGRAEVTHRPGYQVGSR